MELDGARWIHKCILSYIVSCLYSDGALNRKKKNILIFCKIQMAMPSLLLPSLRSNSIFFGKWPSNWQIGRFPVCSLKITRPVRCMMRSNESQANVHRNLQPTWPEISGCWKSCTKFFTLYVSIHIYICVYIDWQALGPQYTSMTNMYSIYNYRIVLYTHISIY